MEVMWISINSSFLCICFDPKTSLQPKLQGANTSVNGCNKVATS